MLELHKKRKRISTATILIAIVILVAFWFGLQIIIENYTRDSIYLELILLCFLGFGFLIISYLIRIG